MNLTRNQFLAVIIVVAAISFGLLLTSYFVIHAGLPTGDSQKAIFWGEQILQHGQPNYGLSANQLNRDPVDFYTPVLHYFTAGLLAVGGLTGVGIAAIILTLITAGVGATLAYQLAPPRWQAFATLISFFLIITHNRFLRFAREPGYHFQNLVGELLLFTLLFLALRLIQAWRWRTFWIVLGVAAMLALTHQFSMFLAVFVFLPAVIALAKEYRSIRISLLVAIAAFVIGGVALGLHEKIPHLFSQEPHLLGETPSPTDYVTLMGAPWLFAGLAGLIVFTITAIKDRKQNPEHVVFAGSVFILLALSQGPRFGIDIPPVRALFYSVIPLSITAALFYTWLFKLLIPLEAGRQWRPWAGVGLAFLIIIPAISSASSAFQLSHTPRTNSTLTPGQLQLIEVLKHSPAGGVLIDDYNRRSASWLLLAGHPMFTRIAADLERQMLEAAQSEERYQLYLKQLDYEKIFALGSQPIISDLLQKHDIKYVTGIENSSTFAFAHNPNLSPATVIDDITLFKARPSSEAKLEDIDRWLLRPTTLANDIGDQEDTHEHLPASLRATRLSEPLTANNQTYRTTTAPIIPLTFNVGDYVRVLWDQDNTGTSDIDLELLVRITNQESRITSFSIQTLSNAAYNLPTDGSLLKIKSADAAFDENGFITFYLLNPEQKPVSLDLIALGLARIP